MKIRAPLKIRRERPEDVPAIHRVVADAFGRETEADLVDLIRTRGESELSLVATDGPKILGHVLLSEVTLVPTPKPRLRIWGVAPVSVAGRHQKKGVGSQLMESAIEQSRKAGVDALVLLGEPAYYGRFGFETTHLGNEYGATKHFMALELVPGCLEGVEALCKYVGSFGELND